VTLGEIDQHHLWHPFTPMRMWRESAPLIIAGAEGNELIDTDGRRYLDGVSSLWCNVHGHRHPTIDEAVRAQLDRVAHSTLLGLGNVPAIELAARLIEIAPPGLTRVFYSDSGSTAVEIALKLAFQFQQLGGDSRRTRFLVLDNAYHGDTIGSVSLGGIDLFHRIFQPLLFHTLRIAPTMDALERAFSEHGTDLAGFVLEPLIQGAGGMLLQPAGFLRRARELCSAHGTLLICDEVATGFGRTGTMFACEQERVRPDLLCLAKGISGGYLPLAATLATESLFERFLGAAEERRTFFHGHTYTGNPLACAAGIASLDVFARDQTLAKLQPKIARVSDLLARQIRPLSAVADIRQLGLMVGIELRDAGPVARPTGVRVCAAARTQGVILRPLGPVVVWMPPLSITSTQIDLLAEVTRDAIRETCGDA
jgi:adenosylmethionine-8-amino-7-oxononanoate aminotransferase